MTGDINVADRVSYIVGSGATLTGRVATLTPHVAVVVLEERPGAARGATIAVSPRSLTVIPEVAS